MECVIVDATILRYFGTSDQLDLLQPWAPLFATPRVVREVRQSRSPAIPRVERALHDGLLSEERKPSDETYRRVLKKGGRQLGTRDTEVVAAALDHDGLVLSDDGNLLRLARSHRVPFLDLVQVLQTLKEESDLIRGADAMELVVERFERLAGKTFKQQDRENLLRY